MVNAPQLQVTRRLKGFEDLPGEIRNTIYRAACDEVSISTEQDPRASIYDPMMIEGVFYMIISEDHHINVSKSFRKPRPLAMLSASRQIQQEFASMLISPSMSPHPDGPYHTCYLYDSLYLHWSGRFFWKFEVSASFRHQDTARIEISFHFGRPYSGSLDQRSVKLIETTISELFDDADKFTFIHFLQAADILFALGPELDMESTDITQLCGPLEYHMALTIREGVSQIFGSCHK